MHCRGVPLEMGRLVKQVNQADNSGDGNEDYQGTQKNRAPSLSAYLPQLVPRERSFVSRHAATLPTHWTGPRFFVPIIFRPRATERLGDLSGITQRFLIGLPFASERKDEFAAGVVVSHHEVHLRERLVAAQLCPTLDCFQIQSGAGVTDPALAARIKEAHSSMS